jgi:uncharacterized protein
VLFGLIAALPAQAASFDCTKAATSIDKLICNDRELLKLDDKLDSAYKASLKNSPHTIAIRQSQRKWMRVRNDCTDTACVKLTYESRLKELTEDTQRADFGEYIPFDTLYTKYNPVLCDKFLGVNINLRIASPSKEDADDFFKMCPNISQSVKNVALDDYALYQVDIDNDGIEDKVLYTYHRYSNIDPGQLFTIDSNTCKQAPVFESYGPKRILILNGGTFIESINICKEDTSMPRYFQCKSLYQKTAGNLLMADQDAVCVFIERDWQENKASKKQ